MIIKQGGDGLVVDEYNRLPMAPMTTVITAPKKGFYKGIETKQLGEWLIRFGGGRKTKADLIDHGVGFIMHKTVGDTLSKNEPFMTIYHHAKQKQIVDELQKDLWKNLVKIAPSKLKKPAVIHATVK
jgi:pyrimidine-nucleoside phosphorylase